MATAGRQSRATQPPYGTKRTNRTCCTRSALTQSRYLEFRLVKSGGDLFVASAFTVVAARTKIYGPTRWGRPVCAPDLQGRMVLIIIVGPPWYPLTTPPPPTATPTPTPTPTPAARLRGRAGCRGNRSGQGGYPGGGADSRSHCAETPKHRDRHTCDGLSQQLGRSLCSSASVRGHQNAISHSALLTFASSSRLHGWIPPQQS
jgi:hypothetical protein